MEKLVRSKLMFVADVDSALVMMVGWGRDTGLKREGWRRYTPIIRGRTFDIGNDALTWSQCQAEGTVVEGHTGGHDSKTATAKNVEEK
jgi:hypothetical protein